MCQYTKYYNGNIPWVKSGELDKGLITDTEEKISEEAIKNSSAKIFPKGTLLIALYGATIGKLAFLGADAATNQAICGIYENEKINSHFLYNYLFYKKQKLVNQGIGGAQPNISQTILKNLDLPLPPKPAQQAIVSKIEELFSALDKGIENLCTAQQQLKTYRQAVLKWAFEGKLTKGLNHDSYDLHDEHDVMLAAEPAADCKTKNNQANQNNHINHGSDNGALPEGWKIQKLNDIGTWKGGGTPSKANKTFWNNGTILWVSPKDMKAKVIYDTIDKITSVAIENSSTKLVSKGSILFVVRSGILRRTLPVAITASDVTVNQDIQAFTPKNILPDYVYWYVQAKNEDIRRECSKDGTTVESIESSLLKNYPIPVCSLNEQTQIVQQIESRLSISDKMEESITQSLQQAEALRQSILKRAFEGRLIGIK
ncbi:restriction endonuclease subunit S [Agriterribacter sp.]|uniref:restriction endonuclease subunit S n=1 Tax=Agriterribacter sp. TaxID=2821509 RepID=UPI002BE35025|nr:restriction endonuclease subunit S [Agriterribacter sp.]HTN08084.1 restriction endonuclease subunit S [Agriterribacter sp.]